MVVGMLIAAALGYCLIGLPVLAKMKRSGSDIELSGSNKVLPFLFLDKGNRYVAEECLILLAFMTD